MAVRKGTKLLIGLGDLTYVFDRFFLKPKALVAKGDVVVNTHFMYSICSY